MDCITFKNDHGSLQEKIFDNMIAYKRSPIEPYRQYRSSRVKL